MKKLIALVLLAAVLLTGCYWNDEVQTHEVGAQMEKNAIRACVGPGVYTDLGYFADIKRYSVATLTFEVEDPEVATADNQLVGVRITIQARRMADCDSVKAFFSNWANLIDDNKLQETIDATTREGLKNGARQFTLTQLLNDRNGLADAIIKQVSLDAGEYHTEIVNVTIENIAIAPEYATVLQQTAKLKADQDYQERRQSLIEQQAKTDLFERQQKQLVLAEQLKVEQAQTNVEVEIAKRAGQKVAAANQVYIDNPAAYTLEQLRIMQQMFGEGTVYFIPVGTDLVTYFLQDGRFIPTPVQP